MTEKIVPFWEEDYWKGYSYYAVPLGQWWIARFIDTPGLCPEELFFHTCTWNETSARAPSGSCRNCGENIPMEYIRKAVFIDRMQDYV
jgi:hypothetical protein